MPFEQPHSDSLLRGFGPFVVSSQVKMKELGKDGCLGAFLGLAIGDAMGAPVEFKRRGKFEPVTGYRSGGPFNLQAGYWTDDTSMSLCLAESLIACRGILDPQDQMQRYANWYLYGHNSSTGKCFDIGNGTRLAIEHSLNKDKPLSFYPESSEGNGSLMRLAPVSIVYHRAPEEIAVGACVMSSSTTHNRYASELCGELGSFLDRFINGYAGKPETNLKEVENSGHAPKSLEAALYHFSSTNSFEEAVLQAVNYGDDADTIGAITGQLAGAYYGLSAIPVDWVQDLYDHERLLALGEQLFNLGEQLVTQ